MDRTELSDFDPESPLLEHFPNFRKKKAKSIWTGLSAKIFLGFIVLILSVTLYRTIKHRRNLSKHPIVEHLDAEFFTDFGSKRVKIRYGPFKTPPSTIDNGMRNFRVKPDAFTYPCKNCLITWMHAILEYPDGSHANADTGLWLHHTVLVNVVKKGVRGCGSHGERFFASGNERTIVDIGLSGTEKSGYWIGEDDEFAMATELMNENDEERDAYLALTWEYIPGMPEEFEKVTPMWLDIGGCKDSDVDVPDQKKFKFASPTWEATISGRVTSILSHLHDGGVSLEVFKNGHSVCNTVPGYGETPEYVGTGDSMNMVHISSMSSCTNVGKMHKGEEWTIEAKYDLEAHEPMDDGHGTPEPIMGIAVMYIVES